MSEPLIVKNAESYDLDTREQLEADVRGYYSHTVSTLVWPPDKNKSTDVLMVPEDTVLSWLDRQAAITRNIERGMHDFILDNLERENDKLRAELETYRKYAEQGECEKPQSEENGDTREQLEEDILAHYKTPEEKLLTVRKWLDRQVAITKRQCEEREDEITDAWQSYLAEVEDERDRLTSERNEFADELKLDAIALDELRKQVDELTAERDKLKKRLENQAAYIAGVEDNLCRCESQLVRDGKNIDELTAERERYRDNMLAQTRRVAELTAERDELRKMLVLDDGTVEEYTERADPLTALAYQKQLAEEWRDRCHNAEAWCDKLEAERDEWKAKAEYQQEILDCDCRDIRDFQNEIDSLTVERDKLKERVARFDSISSIDGIANLLVQVEDLTAERDNLQSAIDAMGNGQFYAMYRAKCDECEQLKEKQEKGGKHDDG